MRAVPRGGLCGRGDRGGGAVDVDAEARAVLRALPQHHACRLHPRLERRAGAFMTVLYVRMTVLHVRMTVLYVRMTVLYVRMTVLYV